MSAPLVSNDSSWRPLTLEEAREHVGARVTFHYPHGENVAGIITSVGTKNVFVRFKHFPGAGSDSCTPDWLSLTPADEWWYLSFVDPDLPEGERWVGGCYVPATSVEEALTVSHVLGINPGGEVQGAGPLDREALFEHVPEKDRRRLLKREDIPDATTWEEEA